MSIKLYFVSAKDLSSVCMKKEGDPAYDLQLEYSRDLNNWTAYDMSTAEKATITINKGEKCYFRAADAGNEKINDNNTNFYHFVITGKVEAHGNIMSLLDNTFSKTEVPSYCFFSLFGWTCDRLVTAPRLPAVTLNSHCYEQMFLQTMIEEMPELPAMTLADSCYSKMFFACHELKNASMLPANWVIVVDM